VVADAEVLVLKDGLQRGLRVVERAVDGEGEDIVRPGAGHLALLQRRHAAVRIQDEDLGAGAAEQAVDGGGAGVARGGAEHGERLVAGHALVLVEVAEELEGEVLEGERGPVEELEHPGLVVELAQRGDVGVVEFRVRGGRHAREVGDRDVGGEEREELAEQLRVRELDPRLPFAGEVGQRLGQEQPAIGREAEGDGLGERDGGSLTAGGDEAHGG